MSLSPVKNIKCYGHQRLCRVSVYGIDNTFIFIEYHLQVYDFYRNKKQGTFQALVNT